MKRITSLFVLVFFGFTLTACVESVSDDEETSRGTFSTSQSEQEAADKLIRDFIDFNGDVTFIDGFTVRNSAVSSSLHLGVYEIEEEPLVADEWALSLQESPARKHGLKYNTKDEGETVFDTSELIEASEFIKAVEQKAVHVAVKVNYNTAEDNYWVYLAIPKEMITAKDDDQIRKLFAQQRYYKK